MKLWQKVMPPITVLPSISQRLHERLKKSHEKTADSEKLPPGFRRDFNDSIVEDHIFDIPFKGATSTRELLTVEEAEALQKRIGDLLETKRFVDREKALMDIPYKSRPLDRKKISREKPVIRKNASSYKPASKVAVSEHPLCHECGAKTVYNNKLSGFVCPKCGLQVD